MSTLLLSLLLVACDGKDGDTSDDTALTADSAAAGGRRGLGAWRRHWDSARVRTTSSGKPASVVYLARPRLALGKSALAIVVVAARRESAKLVVPEGKRVELLAYGRRLVVEHLYNLVRVQGDGMAEPVSMSGVGTSTAVWSGPVLLNGPVNLVEHLQPLSDGFRTQVLHYRPRLPSQAEYDVEVLYQEAIHSSMEGGGAGG